MRKRTAKMLMFGTAAAIGAIAACSDLQTAPKLPLRTPGQTPSKTAATFTCGVQFTEISTIDDASLASYGEGTFTDTALVCENWTGSDYQVSVQQQGTSYGSTYPETLSVVQYNAGQVSGYDAAGAQVADTGVGQSSFDLGNADATEIQASDANPYYGVTSSGGDCNTDPAAFICSPIANRVPSRGSAFNVAPGSDNGIKRREIHALLTGTTELARAPNGNRRFQKTLNGTATTYEVDAQTELLVGEETTKASAHSHASLQWQKIRGRYVRTQLDEDTYDTQAPQAKHTTVSIHISNLAMGAR